MGRSDQVQRRALQQALLHLGKREGCTRVELFTSLGSARHDWQLRVLRVLLEDALIARGGSRNQPVYSAIARPEKLRRIAKDSTQIADILDRAACIYPSDDRAGRIDATTAESAEKHMIEEPSDPVEELSGSGNATNLADEVQTALLNAMLVVAQGIVDVKAQLEAMYGRLKTLEDGVSLLLDAAVTTLPQPVDEQQVADGDENGT